VTVEHANDADESAGTTSTATTVLFRARSRNSQRFNHDDQSEDADADACQSGRACTESFAMNGLSSNAAPGAMYVRALYDYEADDRTSLSFHEGDVIQVITQLESGWWDGVINGVRGWFPSNYCQIITSPDEIPDSIQATAVGQAEDDVDDAEHYDDEFDEEDESDPDGVDGLPFEGIENGDKSRSDFWIPQATPDGRLFYYNMMTGDRSTELPLESPVSSAETGPMDRTGMNISIPDKTRPPPEMMARGGLTRDEDDDSEANSASELEGESLISASRGSLVRIPLPQPASYSFISWY